MGVNFPTTTEVTSDATTNGQQKENFSEWLTATQQLFGAAEEQTYTVSSESFTPQSCDCVLGLPSGTTSANLTLAPLTTMGTGRYLRLRAADDTITITVKNQSSGLAGRFSTWSGGDVVLRAKEWTCFKLVGEAWVEDRLRESATADAAMAAAQAAQTTADAALPKADYAADADLRAVAWVTYRGSNGAIVASRGVASVARLSTGYFRITFTEPFADTNYGMHCNESGYPGNAAAMLSPMVHDSPTYPKTVTSCVIDFRAYSTALMDPALPHLRFYR